MKKTFTPQQKATVALAAIKGEKTVNEISILYGVHPTQVGVWRTQAENALISLFADKRTRAGKTEERTIAELYALVGKRDHELEWLKKSLERCNA
jgi:transposase-like protein